MSKAYKIVLGIFILLFLGVVYLENSSETPVNWTPSYSHTDKIPLGTYVFYNSLKEKAPNLENVTKPPYEFLSDSIEKGTYFFVNNNLMIGEDEFNALLNWTAKGNTLFLSASNFSPYLLDTLHLEEKVKIRSYAKLNQPQYNFVNPSLKKDTAYLFEHNRELIFFNAIDTLEHTVLGICDLKETTATIQDSLVNFIEIPHGKGTVYLNTTPEVFSNYFMLLKNNYEYPEKVLAYLNTSKKLYWDCYYKSGKIIQTSPLYILLSNKSLKWFYYLLIIGATLFVFFEGKRKQKSIDVVLPLKNQTYNYTKTIAGMYLDKKEHKAIAQKQMDQFLQEVWHLLKIPIDKLDEGFVTSLAERTQVEEAKVRQLMAKLSLINKPGKLPKKELIEIHRLITELKQYMYGRTR